MRLRRLDAVSPAEALVQPAIIRAFPGRRGRPRRAGEAGFGVEGMTRAGLGHRRRIAIGLALLVCLAACDESHRHNSAENEFTAWANEVENQSANGQADPDFEEPANIMARIVPANSQ